MQARLHNDNYKNEVHRKHSVGWPNLKIGGFHISSIPNILQVKF